MNKRLEDLYGYPWRMAVSAPWVPWLVVLIIFLAFAVSVRGQEAAPAPTSVEQAPPEADTPAPQPETQLKTKLKQFTVAEQKILSKAESKYWQSLYSAEKAQAELTALVQNARASCESSGGVFDQSQGLAEIVCKKPAPPVAATP